MAKARVAVGLMTGCLLCIGGVARLEAAPTVQQMLGFRPKQEGILFSTPSATELEGCKVELVTGAKAGSNGWLLRDAKGQALRRYFDSNGDKKVDMWSYYYEGAEAYREIDSNYNEKVDNYRWFNAGGCKWGVDVNEDGKIDGWKVISAEECSQEALQAVIARDFGRLQALFINDAEIKSLELPATEMNRLRQLQQKAPAKFQAALAKLKLTEKTHWVRLDAGLPQCLPAEQTGFKTDLVKYLRGSVLYEDNNKHDFLALGEMIQVGAAWRLVDAPGENEATAPVPAELQTILDALRDLDAKGLPSTPADVVKYNTQRADLLLKIAGKDKAENRDQWLRQVADALSAAAQNSGEDKAPYERLAQFVQQIVKEGPGSNLAAYVTFREIQADYQMKLVTVKNPQDYPKIQTQLLERLAQFMQSYPKCEDAPEALMQLGTISEFVNKEIEAKNWYGQLVRDCAGHPLAAKAQGALRRLDLEGKEMVLNHGNVDIAKLRGKMVVVYYWASWNQQCVGDFARLKVLLSSYGSKGLELVCICLDNAPPEAGNPLSKEPPPGIQIAQPGGLDSPLAIHYGIHSLPNLFLVGKDGKVVNRSIQVGNLEDELKKHLK